jgi:hypothetical protein
MRFRPRIFGKAAFVIGAAALLGFVVMVLWNAVVPGLFDGARMINYPHGLGLLVLSRVLFGGFRGRGGIYGHDQWNRTEAMTPLERARFTHCTPPEAPSGLEGRS